MCNRAEDRSSQTRLFPTALFLTLFAYTYCQPLGELQKERHALLNGAAALKQHSQLRARRNERDIVLEISNRNFSRLHNHDRDSADETDDDGDAIIDDGAKSQQTLLTEILSTWIGEERLSAHIGDIDVAIQVCRDNMILLSEIHTWIQMCIANDNARILATMLQHTLNDTVYDSEDSRNRVMLQNIKLAARCGSMECLAQLLGEPDQLDWTGQLRDPECLLYAVLLHAHNGKVAHLIMDRLQQLNLRLECAEIMEAVIERALADIARRLMENNWHRVTPQDEARARGKCLALFREKTMVRDVFVDNASSATLALDDEDWDGAHDFSDAEDEEMFDQ